jgi:hypothetical protein
VPPSPHQRGEGNISNPRVLSDMGLAIPRPTRLGDPRSEPESNSVSVCASLSNIILTSLRCCPFLRAALQLFAAALLLAAMVPTMKPLTCNIVNSLLTNSLTFLLSRHLRYRCWVLVNSLFPSKKSRSVEVNSKT